ncbi:MAG: FkbM family methyltransferase [Proteobacteria bacterium]|nr:FkbM family methyltransferase [Pseudomonadota bacterium]
MKLLFTILKFIVSHPFNSDRKLSAIFTFIRWQTATRLMDVRFLVDWVDGTKFIVQSGEEGITGNLYCGLIDYEGMSFTLHFLKKTDTFYDIGANVGAYSILASGARGCRSICFEPVPSTFDRLVDQIQINRIESLVDARNNGVGDINGILQFTNNKNCINQVNTDPNYTNTIEVDVITLDDNFDPKTPTMVKIDVEGYEKFVIDGGDLFFSNPNVIALLVEINGSGRTFAIQDSEIAKKISSHGFAPISYDPFTRKISSLKNHNNVGNTIYVKDIHDAMERCLESEQFCVHTSNNLRI